MSKKKIFLKLINDERQDKRVLPAKGCAAIFVDFALCAGYAEDICDYRDEEACSNYAVDQCKYYDDAGCTGYANDYCLYDYASDCTTVDRCTIDYD